MRARGIMAVAALSLVQVALANPLNRLPKVVDSAGRSLGGLFAVSSSSPASGIVLRKENGIVTKIAITPNGELVPSNTGFGPGGQMNVYHVTSDCSGTGYIDYEPDLLAPTYVLLEPGTGVPTKTFLYRAGPMEVQTLNSVEKPLSSSECGSAGGTVLPSGYCCQAFTGEGQMAAVGRLDVAAYVPPFTLR